MCVKEEKERNMYKKILMISVLSTSLQANAGVFEFFKPSKVPAEKVFNTVICKEVNDFNAPISVEEVRIELSQTTNLRRINGEQSIRGDLLVKLVNGKIHEQKSMNFTRSGGGRGDNKLADELTARASSNQGAHWVELLLAAPTQDLYDEGIYPVDTDLTGGINIQNDQIDIWLDDQNDTISSKDPLRCKVSTRR